MLVDSSVWIDVPRGTDTPPSRVLLGALPARELMWTCPPVLQEVLQGADSERRMETLAQGLDDIPLLLDLDPRGLAHATARLYAMCLRKGFTLRSPNDCLIAQYTARFEVPLLHRDRDFIELAKVEPRLPLLAP